MNQKINVSDITGGNGIIVSKYDNLTTAFINNQYIDLVNTTSNISIDPTYVSSTIEQHLINSNSNINGIIRENINRAISDQLAEILRNQIQFDVVHWTDDSNRPVFTCQVLFNKQVISEKDISP